jgi:hypothetical protein
MPAAPALHAASGEVADDFGLPDGGLKLLFAS